MKHDWWFDDDIPKATYGSLQCWIDNKNAAVGLGPRTNSEGIRQLKEILGPEIDLHIVDLPDPDSPTKPIVSPELI